MSIAFYAIMAVLALVAGLFLFGFIQEFWNDVRHGNPPDPGVMASPDPTIPDRVVSMVRRNILSNARRILDRRGELHPMAIAISKEGAVEKFNFDNSGGNEEVSAAHVDEWLARKADNTLFSLIATDDPANSRILLVGIFRDESEPRVEFVAYMNDDGKYSYKK